jgi:hypothetical protein
MNRLIYNYPCNVHPTPKSSQLVVDGRTFFGEIDLGLWIVRRSRVQLIGVDLPEAKPGQAASSDDAQKAERAKKCLSLALYGPAGLEDVKPTGVPPVGRRIIVAPMRPNEHGRVVARVYLQVARTYALYSNLTSSIAGFSFLDVNAFMNFLGNWGWDLNKAREIHDSYQVMDCSIG